MNGHVYILLCSNGKYYTGSTTDLDRRIAQHMAGEGANFTRKHPPIQLMYVEQYPRIDTAFKREKQIQGWSRKKKEALIEGRSNELHLLSECKNETNHRLQALRELMASHGLGLSTDMDRPGVSAALNDRTTISSAGVSTALNDRTTISSAGVSAALNDRTTISSAGVSAALNDRGTIADPECSSDPERSRRARNIQGNELLKQAE